MEDGNKNLRELHENLSNSDSLNFNVPYEQFVADMSNEDNLEALHKNMPKYFGGFNVPYNQFKKDMGFDSGEEPSMRKDEQDRTFYQPEAPKTARETTQTPELTYSEKVGSDYEET